MSTPYIAHHGIKGQEWGVRNGPPYPLVQKGKIRYRGRSSSNTEGGEKSHRLSGRLLGASSEAAKQRRLNKIANDKKKLVRLKEEDPETYEELKEQIIKTGSHAQVLNFIGDLDTKQLSNAYSRLDLEKKIKDISPTDVKKGIDISKKLNDAAKVTESIAKAGTAVAKMISAFDDISEKQHKKELKELEEADKKKQEELETKREEKEQKREAKEQKRKVKEQKRKAKESTPVKSLRDTINELNASAESIPGEDPFARVSEQPTSSGTSRKKNRSRKRHNR